MILLYKTQMQIFPDLNALQTFAMVAEDLSFTTVADRRNTVQSAVSAQIKKLESALGHTLVARGRGKAMMLTPEGEAYLVYVRRILALSNEAIETVRTTNARRILRLGTTVSLAMSIVADVLQSFSKQRPDVQIQIQCARSNEIFRMLEEDEIDIAFMMDQGRHETRSFVHSVDLVWVCSRDFAKTDHDEVPLAFLTDGRDLRSYALQALDEAGVRGYVSHLSPHPIGVRTLVQAGLALTVMPRNTIVEPLIAAPQSLRLPSLQPIALAAYRGKSRSSYGDEQFLKLLSASVNPGAKMVSFPV